MANIIFTNKCNLNCAFCFANENKNKNKLESYNIQKTWDIAIFLNKGVFRFCGGEPTLNSEINEATTLLLKSGFNILFMTNGIWPDDFIRYIANLPFQYIPKIKYLFNILQPKLYSKSQIKKINLTLSIINPLNTSLGITIYEDDFEFQYLIDLALKYNIKKIRWSVSAPNMQNNNIFIEKNYNKIASKLFQFLKACTNYGLDLYNDCNYIQPCYFDNDILLKMKLYNNNRISFSCSDHGSPTDIDSDGNAWRCYGLYSVLSANKNNFKSIKELNTYFTQRVKLLDNMHAYEECRTCGLWLNGCKGGCYVYRIKEALKQNKNLILFPIDDDNEILKCKPYKINNLILNKKNEEDIILWENKIIVNEDENSYEFLNIIDGNRSISDLVDIWKSNFSTVDEAKETIIAKCRDLFNKGMIQINYSYNVKPRKRPTYVN